MSEADSRRTAAQQAEVEAALKGMRPEDQRLVREVLDVYPSLTVQEALRMLKEFGGL
jgi:hypothetical protein